MPGVFLPLSCLTVFTAKAAYICENTRENFNPPFHVLIKALPRGSFENNLLPPLEMMTFAS